MDKQTFTLCVGDQTVKHNIILALNADIDIDVTIGPHKKHRSLDQNRLQRKWLLEAEAQGDQTAEEYRGYCKLHIGVPILRNENEEFKAAYDKVIKPLDYGLKLMAMMEPLDFPVTRLMDTKQKTKYLDAMYQFFRGLGFVLTEPMPERFRGEHD